MRPFEFVVAVAEVPNTLPAYHGNACIFSHYRKGKDHFFRVSHQPSLLMGHSAIHYTVYLVFQKAKFCFDFSLADTASMRLLL